MPTLELNREIVEFLIQKSREFQERDDMIFPDEPAGPEQGHAGLMSDSFGEDPIYAELRNTINDLEPDQQVSLVALMWVGRGDYDLDEWNDAHAHASDSWNDHTAEYLIGTPLLPDHLADGLQAFEEVEDEDEA